MTRNVVTLLCLLTLIGGCSEDSKTTNTSIKSSSPTINLLFPLVDSVTTSSSILVRGNASNDVSNVLVNDIVANFDQYAGYWVADVPLEYGYNDLNIKYSNASGVAGNASIRVRRSSPMLYAPTLSSYASSSQKAFIYDSRSMSFVATNLANNTSELIKQITVPGSPDENSYQDELFEQEPISFTVSSDGSRIYYLVSFSSDYYILDLDTSNGDISEFFGPTSPTYTSSLFSATPSLIFDASNNQILITQLTQTDSVNAIDITAKTANSLNVNDLTSEVAGAQFTHWSLRDANTLVFMASTGSNYFTGNITINTGVYSNLTTPASLPSGCPTPSPSKGITYQAEDHLYYWAEEQDICFADTETGNLSNVTNSLQGLPDNNQTNLSFLFSADDNLYAKTASDFDYQLVRYSSWYDRELVGEQLKVGDPHITPSTAREVLLNISGDKAYFVIRDIEGPIDAQIQELTISTQQWREIGSYDGIRLAESLLNSQESAIYTVNDSISGDDEVYRIDLSTGEATAIVDGAQKATVDYPDFDIEALAFDQENQIIYLARKINSGLPADYGSFSLLAWDIGEQRLTEVSPPSNVNSEENMAADYDMVYIARTRSVYFYSRSESNKPIWEINVDSNLRQIISSNDMGSGPNTENTRGMAGSADSSTIYATSQRHQSIYSIDVLTGNRSMLSPASHTFGIPFIQPIGIDINHTYKVALIADESLEGLYQADLLTGYRVLIQN